MEYPSELIRSTSEYNYSNALISYNKGLRDDLPVQVIKHISNKGKINGSIKVDWYKYNDNKIWEFWLIQINHNFYNLTLYYNNNYHIKQFNVITQQRLDLLLQ